MCNLLPISSAFQSHKIDPMAVAATSACALSTSGIRAAITEDASSRIEVRGVSFGLRRNPSARLLCLQHRHSCCRSRDVSRPVASDGTVQTEEPSTAAATPQVKEYHFLLASAQFMLDDEEHFQELMRERLRYFGEKSREQDFWLVIAPSWLSKFPEMEKRVRKPAVALISTDATWITFMKLRLDRVLKGAFEASSVKDALAGNPNAELNLVKPERWVAPYAKYEGPWWTPFLPQQLE